MSRSGYSDDIDQWDLIRWRGAVNSAIRGKRGQQLLSELAAALDAMPEKRLIAYALVTDEGEHCALGVVGQARGLAIIELDPKNPEAVAKAFNIAPAMAREIAFINDDWHGAPPGHRWQRVRAWVEESMTHPGSTGKPERV